MGQTSSKILDQSFAILTVWACMPHVRSYWAAVDPLKQFLLDVTSEQLPNPNSRIALDKDDVDFFGQPKTTIDWQLTTADKHGMAVGNQLFGMELGRAGFGGYDRRYLRMTSRGPVTCMVTSIISGPRGCSRDAAFGVVDEHCRVHNVANLYVAGSSVFPTSGAFNPTLTIVALALRLADHIKEGFR